MKTLKYYKGVQSLKDIKGPAAEAVLHHIMACAMISGQVGLFLNSIQIMESARCGRRKQRNPRRKNGQSTFIFTLLH